jgi:pseudouridine synthase
LIRAGRVKVNGETALIGAAADDLKDRITVDGHLLASQAEKIYLKFNKPRGYTCTNRRFAGEKNIFDLVKIPARLFAVGRLDKDSRGLVLLTNDGDLTQRLSHPKFQHEKIYEVKVSDKMVKPEVIVNKLLKGVNIGEEDGIVRAKNIQYLQNGLFVITLSEGRKRQIRRMFEALGLEVNDLKRISLVGLNLGTIKEGHWVYLTPEEINKLKINQ